MIFYTFIDFLPLEFMFLEEIDKLLGGLSIYFLGTYGEKEMVTQTQLGHFFQDMDLQSLILLADPSF